MAPKIRLDANESAFFNRQLEFIEPEIYRVNFPELKARKFFPVSNAAGAGVSVITYRQYEQYGRAKIVGNNISDIPRVDIAGEEFSQPVRHLAAAYGWNYFELKSAARAGLALETERGVAARRAIEQLIDHIAFYGDDAYGLKGLFNISEIPDESVENDGTGSSTL